ncbi:unnamed protein product [Caenorhabditis angaria]|uniref:C2H2-type domain-containing protein n=1 Tax=Caenorhabditis angaria TaxID=860376 RepID=A0A9P1N7I2_9PELO|nr:unnamed protein product [Caenorhabditis angaria]
MTVFFEYIENMKKLFDEIEADKKCEAIGEIEEFLNWMTFRWQNEEQNEYPILLQNAEEIIFDRFGEDWQIEENQEYNRQNDNMIYYRNPDEDTVPSTSTVTRKIIKCYSCGLELNNEKALYRHGIKSGHKTREKRKYQRKNEEEEVNYGNELPAEILEPEVGNEEDFDFRCFTCGIEFKNRKALYRHGIKLKHPTRIGRSPQKRGGPFKCDLCLCYSTTKFEYLTRHKKRQHNIE